MSLDFDRSPDGEPRTPAGQTPVPTHPAPATTEQEHPDAPRFTPKHAAGEPADDELAGDEPTIVEPTTADPTLAEPATDVPDTGETIDDEREAHHPESAAYEPTAPRPVVSGSVVDEAEPAEPAELADDGPVTSESAPYDQPAAAEPVLADPAAATGGHEAATSEAVPADATASEVTAYGSSAAPAWDAQAADGATAGRAAGTGPAADLDAPLLGDTAELHASWQRIQVAFIDDPRDAVADAAELVDHMGQVLVGALRQRQQQLRAMWDRDIMPGGVDYADSGSLPDTVSSDGDRPAAGDPDTEQLRLLIRRYRALFNELCRP